MRVIGGELGGRRLTAPSGTGTRPTSDRVRAAVFNRLTSHLGGLEDLHVLDLFAGSGALGIEALSRGAATATFVERDRRALAALRSNLAALGLAGRATVVAGDAQAFLDRTGAGDPAAAAVDLAFADPPYAWDDDAWRRLLGALRATTAVLESDREPPPVTGWRMIRSGRYGTTVVTLVDATTPPPHPLDGRGRPT